MVIKQKRIDSVRWIETRSDQNKWDFHLPSDGDKKIGLALITPSSITRQTSHVEKYKIGQDFALLFDLFSSPTDSD